MCTLACVCLSVCAFVCVCTCAFVCVCFPWTSVTVYFLHHQLYPQGSTKALDCCLQSQVIMGCSAVGTNSTDSSFTDQYLPFVY